jgi:tetratricopeptide (TPR) repeat protein
LIDLGDLYAGVRQDTNKAMEFYRQAIQVAPNHAGAHYALGMLLLGRHDALGAIPLLEKSQDLAAGKTPLPSMGLGRAYSQARKWKDAQEAFTRALTIQPGLADAYIGRAGTFLAAGNRAKALADLQKAEESNPNGAEAPLRIGLLQQEDGAAKEAYAAYERALRLEPKLVLAYNNLAWLAATRRERLDEALAWIQKARSLAPKEAMLYDTHGWVLRARGDPAGAMTVLNEGIGLQPSADLHYHLGVVQMEAGRADDARGNFRKALQIQPDFGDAKDAKSRLRQLEAPQGNK